MDAGRWPTPAAVIAVWAAVAGVFGGLLLLTLVVAVRAAAGL